MVLAGSMSFGQNREQVFSALRRSCEEVYGERLITVAIFGSAGGRRGDTDHSRVKF